MRVRRGPPYDGDPSFASVCYPGVNVRCRLQQANDRMLLVDRNTVKDGGHEPPDGPRPDVHPAN